MARERLSNRRLSEVFSFSHLEQTGASTPYVATVGYYDDLRIGEVFIDAVKNESAIGLLCHDAAVLISIALQHGASIEEMRGAIARTQNKDGAPQSVIGTVLDELAAKEKDIKASPNSET